MNRALYVAAAASIAVILALRPTQPPFPTLFSKADIFALSESLDRLFELSGGTKVLFFEVQPSSVCTASALGFSSLASCRGKEWVLRFYKGEALAYELRVDATLGFSSLIANLSHVELERAVAAAAELLKGSKPGIYSVRLEKGKLNVSVWQEVPDVCIEAQASVARWAEISALISVGLHAVLITALIVVVALDTPGLSKKRAAAVALPPLLAACFSRSLLSLQYTLGKLNLAPTLRNAANVLYSDILLALFSLFSLLAGAAVAAKHGATPKPLSSRELAESWLTGVSVGAILSASSAAAFLAAAQAGLALPLSHPLLEQSLSSKAPWAELTLAIAVSAVAAENLYRWLLLAFLMEITRSRGQAIVLESTIFALSFSGYPLYPSYLKVLQTLTIAIALTLLRLSKGLTAAVFANFAFNALSAAVALYPLFPSEAVALALSIVCALPIGCALTLLARFALG